MRTIDADMLKNDILKALAIKDETYLLNDSEKKIWQLIDAQPTIDPEQIKRITKLLNDLDLADVNSAEFDEIFQNQTIKEIKEELWRMYCFASDVCDTLNM